MNPRRNLFTVSRSSKWNCLNTLTWHEYLIWSLLVTVCKNVGTLQCLWEETEDIVDNQESLLRVLRSSRVGLHSINGDPLALLFVAIANNWRHGAAAEYIVRLKAPRCAGRDGKTYACD